MIFAELPEEMAFKSAAQSEFALQDPSAFLSPTAKPRVPVAETIDGAAKSARERREESIVIDGYPKNKLVFLVSC